MGDRKSFLAFSGIGSWRLVPTWAITPLTGPYRQRETAEKLFVSENTVNTHPSRVFDKLGAKRRTKAV
jgi:hypothetical protein